MSTGAPERLVPPEMTPEQLEMLSMAERMLMETLDRSRAATITVEGDDGVVPPIAVPPQVLRTAGHADCIVTSNLADFPADAVAPFGIETIHPDDFLRAQLDLAPFRVLSAFKAMRARRKNPAVTAEAFAQAFERNGLVKTAAVLRQAADLL